MACNVSLAEHGSVTRVATGDLSECMEVCADETIDSTEVTSVVQLLLVG